MAEIPGDEPRRGKVTMRDVAQRAGVGLATVSRVINGKPGVAADLIERVNEAAHALGYRHDVTASSLRRADRRTATIALVLEDVANPFSSALHRAVEDAARAENILVLTGSSDEHPEREHELIDNFTLRRVDGLIVVPTGGTDGQLATVRRQGTPIVCVDRLVELDRVDTVTVDNREGTRAAVRRLLDLGHRRIAYLGDMRSIWTARERYEGYLEAHSGVGRPVDERLVRLDIRSADAAEHAIGEILTTVDDPPTAVFAAQNLLTIGTFRALERLGLHGRVALIGFDDFPLADMLRPGVSVVSQDPTEIGLMAARLLLGRINGGDHRHARHAVVPTGYIARGSGEIPPP
ncbi:LacI family DNA-binding transcriptional regulator [Actinoallomurus sp. NPDC050550]|uniref:LacI family DNA-binding transcriptional regulator n=1 Tax=Actinoallomurus sp. NPDC050550 TaxID=3154937 RepID=UPI0033C48AC9